MDPNATLSLIDDCVTELVWSLQHEDPDADDDHAEELRSHCESLWTWLSKGGFEPNWGDYPTARNVYSAWVLRFKRERAAL